jgi:nitrilase
MKGKYSTFLTPIPFICIMNKNIACVQISPIYLNSKETTDKICRYIEKTSKKNPDLIVFPELILSGYPNFRTPEYRTQYHQASVYVNGPELEQISKTAKAFGVVTVLGFIERDPNFSEVIYDSSCVIDADGTIIGTHRKISPFGAEKVLFKEGDARDIRIFKTKIGKLGIGLCFENLNPLYRRALTLLGEEIHCTLWVSARDTKQVVDSSSRVTAIEGGVFVVLAAQVTSENPEPFIGGSGILDPWGKFITGPVYDREEILFSEINPEFWELRKFQSRGIESRDDLLSLNVATEPYRSLNVKNQEKNRIDVSNTD